MNVSYDRLSALRLLPCEIDSEVEKINHETLKQMKTWRKRTRKIAGAAVELGKRTCIVVLMQRSCLDAINGRKAFALTRVQLRRCERVEIFIVSSLVFDRCYLAIIPFVDFPILKAINTLQKFETRASICLN